MTSSQTTVENITEFDQMGLREEILRGIYSYGFEKPSVIQQKAVPIFSSSRDMIAQAQSGTGKSKSTFLFFSFLIFLSLSTAATYTIGMLQQLDFSVKKCQGIVLVPTRELAQQVCSVVQCIGDYCNVNAHACVGGTIIAQDIEKLKTAQVVIGTPGRLLDMLNRQALFTGNIKVIVLDEADEMLSKGFSVQLKEILLQLPSQAQVGVFSATLPEEVRDYLIRFLIF